MEVIKDLFGSLAIACSMYSRIPMPQVEWTKERMKFALCFFPLVGVVVGALGYGAFYLLWGLGFPVFARAAVVVIPVAVTGGIHLDGYLDVMDALASHGERERKLEILKDPHTGAFAIIWGIVYFVAYGAAIWEMKPWILGAVSAVYVLSRALSGLAVVTFPMAKKSGLAASFSGQADKRIVALVMGLYVLACAGFWWAAGGVSMAVFALVLALGMYGYYYRMAKREFGGITGDLAGYFLQMCELLLLVGFAVLSHVR